MIIIEFKDFFTVILIFFGRTFSKFLNFTIISLGYLLKVTYFSGRVSDRGRSTVKLLKIRVEYRGLTTLS